MSETWCFTLHSIWDIYFRLYSRIAGRNGRRRGRRPSSSCSRRGNSPAASCECCRQRSWRGRGEFPSGRWSQIPSWSRCCRQDENIGMCKGRLQWFNIWVDLHLGCSTHLSPGRSRLIKNLTKFRYHGNIRWWFVHHLVTNRKLYLYI